MIEFAYKPDWLWLVLGSLVAAGFLFWSYRTALGQANAGRRWLILGLRCLTLLVALFCLLDPRRVEPINQQHTAQLAVLLDTSRSMAVEEGGRSRLDVAREWLTQNLPNNSPVSYFVFSEEVTRQERLEAVTNAAGGTALAQALEHLLSLQSSDQTSSLLSGIVLVSDGRDNGGRDPVVVARKYRELKVPLHTLTIGSTNETRDIILENVRVNRRVTEQAVARIIAVLRAPGFKDRSVPVRIKQGERLLSETNVVLTGEAQNVEMRFTPPKRGFQVFTLEVPAQAGERLATNNRRPFGFEVVDPTLRVLYMEGTGDLGAGPECLFLHRCLSREPGIKVKTLYRNQQPESERERVHGVIVDPQTSDKIYRVENPSAGYPRTFDDLMQYDVIINSDIPKGSFTQEQFENTRKFVEEYGGGFVMIGGYTSYGAGGYDQTPLERIIPVAMDEERDAVDAAFKPHVLPSALAHPIMQVGTNAQTIREAWLEKSLQFGGFNRVDRAKPGAEVLIEHPAVRTRHGPCVILAVQEIGKGRSMALTTDTTRGWGQEFETRWGESINSGSPMNERNCDHQYYRQFWINAIRWLAAGRSLNSDLRLELDQSLVGISQPIHAQVLLPPAVVEAEVFLSLVASNHTERKTVAKYDSATRSYRAELLPPGAGQYTVEATARQGTKELGTDRQLLICDGSDSEEKDLRANPQLMTDLANAGDGKALSTAGDLNGSLTTASNPLWTSASELHYTPLWDKPIWLLLIIGLLTVEWIVRRTGGFA